MPLAFQSLSHGTLAFGYFNIESDMLLLDRYFFFTPEFCAAVLSLAEGREDGSGDLVLPGYFIGKRSEIGDLQDAINGTRFTGFIGEIYRRFPFPEDPTQFAQKPDGGKNRLWVENKIASHAQKMQIPMGLDGDHATITMGDYQFDPGEFSRLIHYVWRGGYPRWQNDIRPWCVTSMAETLTRIDNPLLPRIAFDS